METARAINSIPVLYEHTDHEVVPVEISSSSQITSVPASSELHIGEVGGITAKVSVEFSRTAGILAYDANDAVLPSAGGVVEMAGVSRIAGGSGYITGIRIITNKKSITPRFRIHLFSSSDPTLSADGANWKDKYSDSSKRVGFIDLDAMSTAADTTNSDMSRTVNETLRKPFVCASSTTSLYFVLETLDAFTSADGQKFTVVMYIERN
jgi:hypothetical protein